MAGSEQGTGSPSGAVGASLCLAVPRCASLCLADYTVPRRAISILCRPLHAAPSSIMPATRGVGGAGCGLCVWLGEGA